MELETEKATLHIRGTILSVADFERIKEQLESIKKEKEIILKVYDSLVINSSLIGYLVKLINQEAVVIHIQAGQDILIELLEDIGLSSTFNVTKI
ncbi:MAG: hypothetical protein OEW60_08225 [Thiovulaceae bacterium]|nr:hypothetical protein [Sulfurimonadaceae bacterium]